MHRLLCVLRDIPVIRPFWGLGGVACYGFKAELIFGDENRMHRFDMSDTPTTFGDFFAKFMRNLERLALQKRHILGYDTTTGGITNKPEESALCQWILSTMKERGNLLLGWCRIRVQMKEKIEQPLNGWIFDKKPPELSYLVLGFNDGKLTVTPKALEGGTE